VSTVPWRRRFSGVYLPAEEEDVWCLHTRGGGGCLVSTYPRRRRMSGVYLPSEEEDVWCLPTRGGGGFLVSTYPRRRRMSGVYMDDTVFLTHHVQPGNAGQLLPCNHILKNFVCLETVQRPNSWTKSRQKP
jgi:hypothetical protein